MSRTVRTAGLGIILLAILLTLFPISAPAFEIKLGNVREGAIQFLMKQHKLSRDSAEQMMRRFARRNREEIIDSVEFPDGAVADFVTIDPTKSGPDQVRYEGCARLFSPGSEYGKHLLAEIEKMRGTPAYDYFMQRFADAVRQGMFVHELTPEQKDRLLNAGKRPGERDRPAAATPIRILVCSFRPPPWSDRASSPSYLPHGHPILSTPGLNRAERAETAGGGWSNGARVGLNSPAWNEQHRGHDDPTNGADSFVYLLRTDFVERWFTFMFDYGNPNSLANFYRSESHGHLAISGDRSDIAAWLDSHHILDVNPFGSSRDWTPMPGTPIIRPIDPGANFIYRASVETGQFSVLFRDHNVPGRATISNYRFDLPGGTAPDSPPYRPFGTARQDPDDDRHVTFTGVNYRYWNTGATPNAWANTTVANGEGYTLRFCSAGWTGNTSPTPNGTEYTADGNVGEGCAPLPNTVITSSSDLLASRPLNRFKSLCYYTHDHDFNSKSGRPHQLAHVRNGGGDYDDIMGTVQTNLNDHEDRPPPYDHDIDDDDNRPTGGVFGSGGHTAGAWRSACSQVMADWGISTAGYDRVAYVHPYGPAVAKGGHIFIPNAAGSSVMLPENAGLGLAGHEFGHTFGMGDLYDNDYYANAATPPPSPPFFESDATGPYSIMGNGGVRVDPWHKIALGWVTPTLLATGSPLVPQDRTNAPIPEMEGTLQNPVVYKARPDLATGISTAGREYFLIENRNRNGSAWYGDPSPRGMYVWHIDTRFGQVDEVYFAVICEQADGLYQLERQPRGWNAGQPDAMAGDPFPGSLNVRQFTQWTDPNTRAHGVPAGRGQVVPGSAHDSFFRVDGISDPGPTMRANLWVQPRELIVTGTSYAPPTAFQGEKNVPTLGLHLDNNSTSPNISQGDVVIRDIRIDESGNSNTDTDAARALLYEDVGTIGTVEPGTDVLLQTAPVVGQAATFTGLSFRVILGTTRDLIIAYDIADTAQTEVTLGAGIDHPFPNYDPASPWSAITPQIPGTIQERIRTGVGTFGDAWFPLRSDSDKVVIVEAPDTLTVTPNDVAPATAIQGTPDVPMLGLRLHVDRDTVELQSLRVDTTGTSSRVGDVAGKLYDDANINGVLDPGEALVDTATFSQPGGSGTPIYAVFDDLHSYQITETADRGLLVLYDFATDATVGRTVNVTLQNAGHVTLIEPDDVVSTANFPMASSDTMIVINNPPALTDTATPPGTSDWLTPTTGTPTTLFTWNAVYTDAENDPPSPIQVFIDGAPQAMFAVNPVDTNYTDGALFRYQTTLPVGNHTYYMLASDGNSSVRYPPVAPATYPYPVVVNTPPVLSNGGVTPMRGDNTTTFTYRITFTDADAHMASFVRVLIDGGGGLAMTETDPLDVDTTDGKQYELALTPGTLTPGAHKAIFRANDGYDTVTWPPIGAMSGPIVSSSSSGFFADDAYNVKSGPYEEGDPIYAQITDIDQNLNVGALDTLQVTLRASSSLGSDNETIALIETAVDSGIFRTLPSGVPTLGRAGTPGDGVLNVMSGPSGANLLLQYTDPYDSADRQNLTGRVVDTVAPTPIAAPELLVSADTNGSVVTVNFTAYDEAAQVDVNRYRVFYELSPAPIGTLTPRATVMAGTQTVQIPTGGPGPDVYIAVAVYDEVPNVDTAVNWKMASTADTAPPVLVGPSPANGATEVALNTDISFRVEDAGSGVAESDIRVRIRQEPADPVWRDITSDVVITGTASSRRVDYDPPANFLYNQLIRVRVVAQDMATNSMTTTFSFSTVTDVDPPQIANISPADGETNVPVDTNISFDLLDAISGVDDASIRVTVEGTNVTSALVLTGTPDARTVEYDPAGNFPYGATIDVTVDASDVAGNAMATATFSFETIPDNAGTVIDQLSPANGATDVLIGANISFRVQDAVSGVDLSTVTLTIDGSPATLGPTNFQRLSPTAYLVTYDPPSDFGYGATVRVRASARDNAGNPATTVQWQFTTEPPPTYSITGTILETLPEESPAQAQQVGVPGVAVAIKQASTGQVVMTVQTAGTGVYQAMGLLDGTYLVEPTLTDYRFTSVKSGKSFQRVYVGAKDTDGDGNPELDASGVDFDAVRRLYSIKGQVLEGGAGLQGVQVTDGTRTALTGADGQYSIDNVPSGTYTVTPSLTNYTFSPGSRAAVVASANATSIDFTAQARTYSVSGTVSDSGGGRLAGVEVRVQGGSGVAVTSRAGQYTLAGVKAGLQTFVATRDGYTFEPGPGVVVENVMVDHDLTGIDFVGYPVVGRMLAAGIHFIGVPTKPRSTDAETVFGTKDVARWSPTSVPPRYYTAQLEPTAAILRVEPAAGFFVRLGQPTALNVPGTPVPLTTPFGFVINQGWNMQANPFPSALAYANLQPNVPSGMAPYGFVLENGQYELVSDVPALGGRRWIDGWEGIWLLGNAAGTTITALPPGSSPAAAADEPAKRVVDRNNWQIPIVARTAGSVDACSAVGVSSQTGDLVVANPPALTGAVDLVLHGKGGEALAYDLRGTLGTAATWRFSVYTEAARADVQVALPDLSEVPEDLAVTLVDVAAGKACYARTMSSYIYDSGQGGAREFVLKVEPRKTTGLTIRTAGASLGPQGAAITYVLSADADVQARVLNISGRSVRTLTRSKAVAAGTNTLTWDLSSDSRTRVPNGLYLVEIEAVTQDGQRAKALEHINVSR